MAVDPAVAHDRAVSFLEERLPPGADRYVIGVSGGIDSTVALHLAVEAVGAECVTGLVLPDHPSAPENMKDARDLCERVGAEWREANIAPLVAAYTDRMPYDVDTLSLGNLRARTRMVFLYLEANVHDGLVVGPDNRSEYLLGYFTKFGDGAADVRPLGDLYKTEVYDLAEHVGVDEKFIEKTPTAELWAGQTDEGEIGAKYESIDAFLRAYVDADEGVEEAADSAGVDGETAERLADLVDGSGHKRDVPPTASMPN
ncbi:NAD+ synthase [Natronomonas sp.]|uniref:NAD+ synthase n=1 Tax=Natronomonas sp. TaxID=2184060 RepID=UPI002FC365C1